MFHIARKRREYLEDYDEVSREEDKTQEKKSDLLAEYFLIAEKGFISERKETYGMPFVERVMKIESIFKVSYKTVLNRLNQMGIVDDRIWFRFQNLYEAKYNKKLSFKEEPIGLKPFDFYADRLNRLVRKAVEDEKISISRAAEILNLSFEKMTERITEWEDLGDFRL